MRVSWAIWITLENSSHMTLYPSAFRHWKFSHRMTKIKLLPSRGQCTSNAVLDVCLCVRLCNGDNLYNQVRHAYGDDSRLVQWWVHFFSQKSKEVRAYIFPHRLQEELSCSLNTKVLPTGLLFFKPDFQKELSLHCNTEWVSSPLPATGQKQNVKTNLILKVSSLRRNF